MSAGQFHWSRNPIRLYRDTERGKVAGVCAGLANYFDIRVKFASGWRSSWAWCSASSCRS